MYIVKCTFSCSDQTLAQVAVAVAGSVHYENEYAFHFRIQIAEHPFRKLQLRAQVVRNIEAAVPKILACPQPVRQHEAVHAEEGNGFERGLCELAVLEVSQERNMFYSSYIIAFFFYFFSD